MVTKEISVENLFPEMPGSSRVWIYQANRFLNESEVTLINKLAGEFVRSWESHGSKLKADFSILHNLFLVFSVDENQHEASGCSIDKSVNCVKSIQELTSLNFFDRTIVSYYKKDNTIGLATL